MVKAMFRRWAREAKTLFRFRPEVCVSALQPSIPVLGTGAVGGPVMREPRDTSAVVEAQLRNEGNSARYEQGGNLSCPVEGRKDCAVECLALK